MRYTSSAQWVPSLDTRTHLIHGAARRGVVEAEIRQLASEAGLVEDQSTSINGTASKTELEDLLPLLLPEAFPPRSYEIEIPVHDGTYQFISGDLIPDPHIPGMRLFHFLTFQGVKAFQPCHKDIETLGMFEVLDQIENSDPIFKAAREWSCTVQAIEDLPKAVR